MSNARELIDRYFDLAPRPDADAYFAQFAADALVEDEGQAHRGIAAIRAGLIKFFAGEPGRLFILSGLRSAGPA